MGKRRDNRERALEIAVEALIRYADPESYHSIHLIPDRPSGWFADDLGDAKHPQYRRKMPGAAARRALARIGKLLGVDM